MPWIGAVIGAGASLIGGSMQAGAAEDAANTTAAATREQTALQKQMYKEGVQRQQPFYEAGVNALGQYVQGIQPGGTLARDFTLADYQADPGYAFRLQEGIKALDRSAAARGGLLSGNQLRGVNEYGQNLASQEFGNAYNRFINQQNVRRNALASLAGLGQTTAGALNTLGSQYGANTANLAMNQATNQANAGLVGSRAWGSAYGDVANQLGKVNWRQAFGGGGNLNSGYGAGGGREFDFSQNMQDYGM